MAGCWGGLFAAGAPSNSTPYLEDGLSVSSNTAALKAPQRQRLLVHLHGESGGGRRRGGSVSSHEEGSGISDDDKVIRGR